MSGRSGDSFSDFMALVECFDSEPSLENYLELRKQSGCTSTELSRLSYVVSSSSLAIEFENYSLEPMLLAGVLGGDERDMDALCLQLIERLVHRRQKENSGEVHLQTVGGQIPDALINFLLLVMLETCSDLDVPLPPAMIVLLRDRLGGPSPDRYKTAAMQEKKRRAVMIAAGIFSDNREVSIRQIAKELGVQPSTVTRWFEPGELQREAQRVRNWFVKPDNLKTPKKR